MKFLSALLFVFASQYCLAEKDCDIKTKDLTFTTPTSGDIANTFWQDDKDGYETIKRLFITYKDGSSAVIEHKYCSMYNFEVAYYVSDAKTLSNTKNVQAKMKSFLTYSALKDTDQNEAIADLIGHLSEYKFTSEKPFIRGYSGYAPDLGDSTYSLSYYPFEGPSSIHEAAFFIYMGIGGMH